MNRTSISTATTTTRAGDDRVAGDGGGVVVSRRLGPGPATVEGLRWLARVGPAPIDAWGCAMGWVPGTARSHAARLTRVGWVARAAMRHGGGWLLFATRLGVHVAVVPVPPAPEPAPTWWAHLAGCAWVAAWLTARGREILGPRELLVDDSWRGELNGVSTPRRAVHRPDLVGVVPSRRPAAIEVELARKSKARLRAILSLHARWIRDWPLRSVCVRLRGRGNPRARHQSGRPGRSESRRPQPPGRSARDGQGTGARGQR